MAGGSRTRLGAWSGVATLALAGGLVLAGPASAAETAGEALLARWVAEAEAGGSRVTVAETRVDAAAGRVEWRDVRVTSAAAPDGALTVRAARFEGLAERDGALLAARVELDDVGFGDGAGKAAIGFVGLSDAYLPDLKNLTPPDTVSPAAVRRLVDALRPLRLTAGEVRDVVVDVADTAVDAPAGARLGIGVGRVSVEGLGDGRLARFAVARASLNGSDKGQPIRLGVDEMRLERIDLDVVAGFVDRALYPGGRGDGVWRDVIGAYAVDGFTVEAAEASIRLGHYGIEGLALRRLDGAVLDLVEAGGAADVVTTARGVLGLLDSIRLGRYGIDRVAVAFTAPARDGGAATRGRIALDSVEVRDLSLAGLGAYRIGGLALAVEDIGVTLKEFLIGDLGFPAPAAIIAAVAAAQTGAPPPQPTALLPRIGTVRVAGLAVDVPVVGRIGLERLELRQADFLGGLPTLATLDVTGFSLPAGLPEPEWRALLKAYGRDALEIAARLTLRYDEAAATLAESFSLDIGGDGTLGLTATLTGVARELFLAPEKVEDYLGEIGVGGLSVTLDDKGLGGRLFAVAGARLGVPAEDLRRLARERLPQLVAPIFDPARRQAVRTALARLLDAPGTLTFAARPAGPVPILQVAATIAANPWRLLDILAVEASAGP